MVKGILLGFLHFSSPGENAERYSNQDESECYWEPLRVILLDIAIASISVDRTEVTIGENLTFYVSVLNNETNVILLFIEGLTQMKRIRRWNYNLNQALATIYVEFIPCSASNNASITPPPPPPHIAFYS